MHALVLRGPYRIEVVEVDTPTPGPDEVLIKVVATGICGSDFHGYSGENGRRHPGQVMGHETAGHVHALGSDVTGLVEGQLVTVNPVLSCDRCEVCASGAEQSCPNRSVIGVAPDIVSAFADYLCVRASNVIALPDDLEPELGALVEPLAVGYHAAVRGSCGPDDRVLVLGGGPIGQSCLLAAQRLGVANVVVSDPNPARRALCEGLGARSVDPTADGSDQAAELLGGRPTLVLDAVGIDASLADALAWSGFGARVVLVGMGSQRLTLAAYAVSTEERTVIGSFCYTRAHFADTADWVGSRPAGLSTLIDGRVGWADAPRSFDELARGTSQASKIVVFPHGVPTR